MNNTNVLGELSEYISEIEYSNLVDEVVEIAERCVIDAIGVSYPGSMDGAGSKARSVSNRLGSDGQVPLLGTENRASPLRAAFNNGISIHALDFDDTLRAVPSHPSSVIVPAVLSAAFVEDNSGEKLIASYVAGVETALYISSAINPSHFNHGWHPTSTIGIFSSAGAAATFLQQDRPEIERTMNIAASMAAGLRANFGSDTKPLHSGHAAESGLKAALLADEGFTAGDEAFDGEQGFLAIYAGSDEPDVAATPALTGRLLLENGIDLKKHPCVHSSHGCLEAAAHVSSEYDIHRSDITAVQVRVSELAYNATRSKPPQTGLEAKFSIPYIVSSAIVERDLTIDTFDEAALDDPAKRQLQSLIECEKDPTLSDTPFGGSVEIRTGNNAYKKEIRYPSGSHENPLTESEFRKKFISCFESSGKTKDEARKYYDRLSDLRNYGSVADLCADL